MMKQLMHDPVATAMTIISVLVIIWAAGRVSTEDYHDAVRAQQVYCQRVHEHEWPDYNGNYKEVCNADGTIRVK